MPIACSGNWNRSRKMYETPSRPPQANPERSSAMADPVLKFPPEQKGAPPVKPRVKLAAEPRRRLLAGMRRYRRFLLLVVLPLAVAIGGLVPYRHRGRFVPP